MLKVSRTAPAAMALMGTVALGCTGSVGGVGDDGDPRSPGSPGTGVPGSVDTPEGPCEAESIRPRIWALTETQYARAMKQVFGHQPALDGYPRDLVDLRTGFSNSPDQLFYSEKHVDLFQSNAEQAAVTFARSTLAKTTCLNSTPVDRACIDGFIRPLALLAQRRPPTDDEVNALRDLFVTTRTAQTAAAGVEAIIIYLALSPHFLFRNELPADGSDDRLDAFGMASVLAFGLTDAPPSRELLDRAAAGDLDNADTVKQVALDLIRSPEAAEKLGRFMQAQMGLHKLAARNAGVDKATLDATVEEVAAFTRNLMATPGATFRDLLTAPFSVVDSQVAKVYGVTAPNAPWTRVDLDPEVRSGVLTQPAWLTAYPDALHRGLVVRSSFLCGEIPPLPENAGDLILQLPKTPDDATAQEKWAAFEKERSGCAACHHLFQPLGLAFENFDDTGNYRTENAFGRPVNGEGTFDDGIWQLAFTSAPDLARQIADDPQGPGCFAQRYFGYVLGHVPAVENSCLTATLRQQVGRADVTLEAMMQALVTVDAFTRRTKGGQ